MFLEFFTDLVLKYGSCVIQVSCFRCHVSGVMCQVSGVRYNISCVTYQLLKKMFSAQLVGAGSVISRATLSSFFETAKSLKKNILFFLCCLWLSEPGDSAWVSCISPWLWQCSLDSRQQTLAIASHAKLHWELLPFTNPPTRVDSNRTQPLAVAAD